MWAAEQPYPPAGYSGWWWVVGAAAVVMAVGLVVLARGAARRARLDTPAPVPDADAGLGAQQVCLAEIDEIAAALARGQLSGRDAHHRLSTAVRQFAGVACGKDALAMTPDDLVRHGRADVADVVRCCWPAQFDHPSAGADGGDHALRVARRAVAGWRP